MPYSLMGRQCLELCLACGRCAESVCWVSGRTTEWTYKGGPRYRSAPVVADFPRPQLESPAAPGQRDQLRSCLLLLQKASFGANDGSLACSHGECHLLHDASNSGSFPDEGPGFGLCSDRSWGNAQGSVRICVSSLTSTHYIKSAFFQLLRNRKNHDVCRGLKE